MMNCTRTWLSWETGDRRNVIHEFARNLPASHSLPQSVTLSPVSCRSEQLEQLTCCPTTLVRAMIMRHVLPLRRGSHVGSASAPLESGKISIEFEFVRLPKLESPAYVRPGWNRYGRSLFQANRSKRLPQVQQFS